VISLAQQPLRARWLPSTGLSSLDLFRRNAKWRTSGFSSYRPYPGPRYGRPSTGQRVVRASRSWPTSWRNGVASLFPTNPRIGSPPCKRSMLDRPEHRPPTNPRIGSPPCKRSMLDRPEHRPGHRPHRHAFLDGRPNAFAAQRTAKRTGEKKPRR